MTKFNIIINEICKNGGKCYYVGGYVRDHLLNIYTNDIDIEVYHIEFENLVEIISRHAKVDVNTKFKTIKIDDSFVIEFAIPRTERCIGSGHSDFIIDANPNLNKTKAASRRDFTINAILLDCITNDYCDIYDGLKDLELKELRHITKNFIEDPLRVMRALRFASRLGFKINDETLKLCKSMIPNLDFISKERFAEEFDIYIRGQYLTLTINYFNHLLSDYFNVKNSSFSYKTNNSYVQKLLFYYNLKDNDLDKLINKTIVLKQELKDITFILNNDLTFNNIYIYLKNFDHELLKELLACLYNVECSELIDYYKSLRNKYNGNYFKDKGFTNEAIKNEIDTTISNKISINYHKYIKEI